MPNHLIYKMVSLITVIGAVFCAGVLMLIPSTAYAQECFPAPEGLLGWWPGDGNATDRQGVNHGVLFNGTAFGQGIVEEAFDFDGIDDYVNVPATLLDGQQSFTIDAWIHARRLDGVMIIAGEPGGAQIQTLPEGKVRFAWKQSGNIFGIDTQAEVVLVDTWTHVAGTYDGTIQKGSVFINGARILGPAQGINFGTGWTSQPLQIGGYGPPSNASQQALFSGLIDEVQIFNRMLDDNEILGIYNAGNAGICQALALTCEGFDPPMDSGPVTVKKNRVLPLKAEINNGDVAVTDSDILAPPVIQVLYDSGIGAATDVTDDALPVGMGTEGNQFEFDDILWHLNLKTKNYSAPGTYTIIMQSGDEAEYLIDPTCSAQFVIK